MVQVCSGDEDDGPASGLQPVQPLPVLRELPRLGVPRTVVLDGEPEVGPREVHPGDLAPLVPENDGV